MIKYNVYWDDLIIGIVYHDSKLGYRYLPNLANIEEAKTKGLLESLVNTKTEWDQKLPAYILRRMEENSKGSATDKLKIEKV